MTKTNDSPKNRFASLPPIPLGTQQECRFRGALDDTLEIFPPCEITKEALAAQYHTVEAAE